ncbi:MAG TPA: cytochrome C oxidase subunit IV family protein [Flavilitoribacter sp.]|nr:cytochrome C oxidase subunit IV family protein [Lewinella sp.]MCB9278859.1 cytochrome C oxidase subunit IV family protein [Lewinellaceae bacterium]HMQ62058.1 cytochrome C oxidase subunit IV family protein [Flavilitoribacter sp.]HMQ89850.1 cytochrome C oxidase subunit IV family protein [Flavilitoribacter sp.]
MSNLSYEESKKKVFKGLWLLAGVTVAEVLISLFGKGYIGGDIAHSVSWLIYIVGLAIITLSIYKAYFIIYEFMHMRYEVKTLAMSVLLPTVLLVWAIIAFFQEGGSWKARRQQIKEKNEQPAKQEGMLQDDPETIHLWG